VVSFEELKKIHLLETLDDSMLGKILPFTQMHLFGDRTVIFKEGQHAENFYMLVKGKVVLEVEASASIMISLGAIKPGYSFGWSALLRGSPYSSTAICVEPCELMAIPGNRFMHLLEENHSMGYRVMQGIITILKNRLERRTEQFLKTLRTHPDIENLF
jgi:CRP/FNR family transcriptional regulator, cyclic AMP receptor protein